ncbi:LOW QUALITY PROTEIN: hypothetical protein Nmel_000428 [Mimus melanotis]
MFPHIMWYFENISLTGLKEKKSGEQTKPINANGVPQEDLHNLLSEIMWPHHEYLGLQALLDLSARIPQPENPGDFHTCLKFWNSGLKLTAFGCEQEEQAGVSLVPKKQNFICQRATLR